MTIPFKTIEEAENELKKVRAVLKEYQDRELELYIILKYRDKYFKPQNEN